MVVLDFAHNGSRDWLNSSPLSLQQLRGKIVLVNFFVYPSIHCIRSFPALNRIWDRYSKFGVHVIGVHSPNFLFEKNVKHVQAALLRHDVKYPVLLDNTLATSVQFEVLRLPTVFLINSQGNVILRHDGEMGYNAIETMILKELAVMGHKIQSVIPSEVYRFSDPETSPELFTGLDTGGGVYGSSRVRLAQGADEFRLPQVFHPHTLYPQGEWHEKSDHMILMGDCGSFSACVIAKEVYVILDSEGILEVEIDFGPMESFEQGVDVTSRGGKSIVIPHGPDVYNIFRSSEVTEFTLTLRGAKGFIVYSIVSQ